MKATAMILFAALLLGAATAPADDFPQSPWVELCETCGFENLTEEQLYCVESILAGMPAVDYTAMGAVQYFLDDGWEVVALHAAVDRDPDSIMDDILQLAVIRGKRVLVKTTLSDNILPPGYYLADGTGSAIHILSPDGEKILYWVERTF